VISGLYPAVLNWLRISVHWLAVLFSFSLAGGFLRVPLGATLSRWSLFSVRRGPGYSSRSSRLMIYV